MLRAWVCPDLDSGCLVLPASLLTGILLCSEAEHPPTHTHSHPGPRDLAPTGLGLTVTFVCNRFVWVSSRQAPTSSSTSNARLQRTGLGVGVLVTQVADDRAPFHPTVS